MLSDHPPTGQDKEPGHYCAANHGVSRHVSPGRDKPRAADQRDQKRRAAERAGRADTEEWNTEFHEYSPSSD